jgi:hypothetical protein
MLTRQFVLQTLELYFSRCDVVRESAPLSFTNLLTRWEYRNALAKLYAASPNGWLTPAMVFQPWYSYALARYMSEQHTIQTPKSSPRPLLIYEIGGGNGTNARHILDWLRRHAPKTYASCHYSLLEFSPRLRDAQTAAVASHGAKRVSIVAADATDLDAAPIAPEPRACFVLGLEVLDNLPHDKVVCIDKCWHETRVVAGSHLQSLVAADPLSRASHTAPSDVDFGDLSGSLSVDSFDRSRGGVAQGLTETYAPVQDRLVEHLLKVGLSLGLPSFTSGPPSLPQVRGRALHAAKSLLRGRFDWLQLPQQPDGVQHAAYVPTGALQMLQGLRKLLPQHRLLLADFDGLPPPSVHAQTVRTDTRVLMYCPAHNSPITASKDPEKR